MLAEQAAARCAEHAALGTARSPGRAKRGSSEKKTSQATGKQHVTTAQTSAALQLLSVRTTPAARSEPQRSQQQQLRAGYGTDSCTSAEVRSPLSSNHEYLRRLLYVNYEWEPIKLCTSSGRFGIAPPGLEPDSPRRTPGPQPLGAAQGCPTGTLGCWLVCAGW